MTESGALREQVEAIKVAAPLVSALGWAPFIARTAWIVDHLDDVASDLSAFHRVDDYMTLESARFFSLAERLGAYSGVVAARAYAEQHPEAAVRTTGRGEKIIELDESIALAQLEADGLLEREVA